MLLIKRCGYLFLSYIKNLKTKPNQNQALQMEKNKIIWEQKPSCALPTPLGHMQQGNCLKARHFVIRGVNWICAMLCLLDGLLQRA